jgi:hypothetical protein
MGSNDRRHLMIVEIDRLSNPMEICHYFDRAKMAILSVVSIELGAKLLRYQIKPDFQGAIDP